MWLSFDLEKSRRPNIWGLQTCEPSRTMIILPSLVFAHLHVPPSLQPSEPPAHFEDLLRGYEPQLLVE